MEKHKLEYVDANRGRCLCGWHYENDMPAVISKMSRTDHVLDMYLLHVKLETQKKK